MKVFFYPSFPALLPSLVGKRTRVSRESRLPSRVQSSCSGSTAKEVGRHASIMKMCLSIEPLSEERHQEFIEFIYREFFPREPLALASGLANKTNPNTIETFVQWMNQGISLVVIDPESNQIVAGVLNCYLHKSDDMVDYNCLEKEDRCIWQFLDHLEIDYNVFEQLQVDSGIELVFLCVQQSHTGRGLARRLTEETIKSAQRLGMPFIKTNPSTPGKNKINNSVQIQLT